MIEDLYNKNVMLMNRINFTKYNLLPRSIGEVIEIIYRGNYNIHDNEFGDMNLKEATDLVRSHPNDMQNMKFRFLPAVTFNGTFSEIKETGIETYSQITALDFDHVNDLDGLKARLMGCPHVFCVFTTPSGNGLKALVLHDNTDPSKHRDMYEQLLSMFSEASQDPSCKDLARRNYLCYDPNVWINQDVEPYHYVPSNKPQMSNHPFLVSNNPNQNYHVGVSEKRILDVMIATWKRKHPEAWVEGNRASGIFKFACMLCKWGVDISLVKDRFTKEWGDMDVKEVIGHIEGAYNAEHGNFNTKEFKIYNKRKS